MDTPARRPLRAVAAALVSLGALGALVAPAPASAEMIEHEQRVEVSSTLACDGLDEAVDLSGFYHRFFGRVEARDGIWWVRSFGNAQGVEGLGATSGTRYRLSGQTMDRQAYGGGDSVHVVFLNRSRLTGTGGSAGILIVQRVHITVDANGVPRVVDEGIRLECGD